MISYNVIGQINGTDPTKTIILSCLYDSMWCQGAADSATGIGIVMAIAKYMKELEVNYSISPKYNVQFIAFGAEEYGALGAKYYEAYHRIFKDINVSHIIDLNQLGFNQPDQADPELQMNIAVNRNHVNKIVSAITDKTR